ncbi:hypothetical protein [Chitinophaga sp. CF418]|uniref:hypothetical protein n=1 Tax=Chitinophaga sp. CF418 TaxID=1855287 RepID=UPI000913F6C5|nr:hypothetical protein [Chitinophaga sp. CF418]SHN25499.1 hypothetical protein SAMN05216311_107357 [Chitinophaga sp. CF418]
MTDPIKVTKAYLDILNQVFEIEKKLSVLQEPNSIQRNVNKLKEIMEQGLGIQGSDDTTGFVYHNPIGEDYNITRTDCEASIAGESTDNLQITEVIKPIIRLHSGGAGFIVQKAVVVVKAKNNQ